MATLLLDLSWPAGGDRLIVSAEPHPVAPPPGQERWFDVTIDVRAQPWSGSLTEIMTERMLAEWADSLVTVRHAEHVVVLGGNRSATLRLELGPAVGGGAGADELVVEGTLLVSEDDPWPKLQWLMFKQRAASFTGAAASVRDLLVGP